MLKTYITFDEAALGEGLPKGVDFVAQGIFSIPASSALPSGAVVGSGAEFEQAVANFLKDEKLRLLGNVKIEHAKALDLLSDKKTAEERDTWPMKVYFYKEMQAGSLTDDDRAKVAKAIKDDETVEQYLEAVYSKFNAYADMALFAEGFKRKANDSIRALSTLEERDRVVSAASAEMKQAIAAYMAAIS